MRRGLTPILFIGIALVATGIWILSVTGGAEAQQGTSVKSYDRPRDLTEQEMRAAFDYIQGTKNFRGGAVSVSPSGVTANNLQRHGVYRIVPAGFSGALPYEDFHDPAMPRGTKTDDVAILRNSPLYVDPGPLPDDLSLKGMDTFDGDSNTVVRQTFADPGGSKQITVTRARRNVRPIDILAPPTDGSSKLEMELRTIGGSEAVVFRPSANGGENFVVGQVIFYQGGVNTTITGVGVDVSVLIEIAEHIANVAGGR